MLNYLVAALTAYLIIVEELYKTQCKMLSHDTKNAIDLFKKQRNNEKIWPSKID